MQYQQTVTLNQNDCRRAHFLLNRLIYDNTICTVNPRGTGICNEDRGNPLVSQNNELVGIASWYVVCGGALPNVYVRIASHVEWINSVINWQN